MAEEWDEIFALRVDESIDGLDGNALAPVRVLRRLAFFLAPSGYLFRRPMQAKFLFDVFLESRSDDEFRMDILIRERSPFTAKPVGLRRFVPAGDGIAVAGEFVRDRGRGPADPPPNIFLAMSCPPERLYLQALFFVKLDVRHRQKGG